ncbi:DMT family transporter [Lentibacter sp. XHP0401]|uniref:DMT family transporter n=1 Tax=Lentibacter sp. XHP0401 TaxID=2984334 RepID=UPI0021E79D3A|nr:DMT family transporter [Lentibacter sp. XHP0401]MCV2893518.1 DMT family transporter [Lentibacter sp. XHP0401]
MKALALPNARRAVILMLTATFFIASSTLMAKLASDPRFGPPLHPLQISHGRFVFAFLLISSLVLATRQRIVQPNLKLHAARSFVGWSGITLMFTAIAFIPMADATAISFLNPVFAMVFAIPLLGEKVGPIRWSAAAIAFCGALILLRPSPASFEFGALFALAAAIFMGLEVIFIKRLASAEQPMQILFVNNTMGLAIASLAVLPVWHMPTAAQWLVLAGVGSAMACAQFFYVSAMARAEASYIAPFAFTTLIFAAAYDAALFNAWPDAVTALGALVILSGAGLLAWRESQLKPAASSPE